MDKIDLKEPHLVKFKNGKYGIRRLEVRIKPHNDYADVEVKEFKFLYNHLNSGPFNGRDIYDPLNYWNINRAYYFNDDKRPKHLLKEYKDYVSGLDDLGEVVDYAP